VLFSDPGGLHWLAGQGSAPEGLRLVLTSAQHFGAAQRARLAEGVAAPVVNYYSSTEVGPMAWECLGATGRFHVLHPDVHVESVGGELVVTRLRDSVLPLLRYLPGDRGTVERGRCDCGFDGDSIVGLDGRRACSFLRPDGAPVDAWSLAATFKQVELRQFRLTQEGSNAFLLEVDAEAEVGLHGLGEAVDAALVRLGWAMPQVTIRRERLAGPVKPEPFVCGWVPGR
jgi:phenylacetate-CoA ligase